MERMGQDMGMFKGMTSPSWISRAGGEDGVEGEEF